MTLAVLMSTYNGEKYIDEQIQSILNQTGVDSHLFIRDDGSKDNTVYKIKQWQEQYPERIVCYIGENKGYRKSFLELLQLTPDQFDYYAFADQDDVWLENKCSAAIEQLQGKQAVSLYVSNLQITDAQLNVLHTTKQENRILDFRSYWTRPTFAGCTFVFTPMLKRCAEKLIPTDWPSESFPSHDFFVATIAFVAGDVVFDKNAYILHRRTDHSVTSGGRGISNRIKIELKVLLHEIDVQSLMAKNLLKESSLAISDENRNFLVMVSKYKEQVQLRLALIFGNHLRTGKFMFDVGARLKVLISNY